MFHSAYEPSPNDSSYTFFSQLSHPPAFTPFTSKFDATSTDHSLIPQEEAAIGACPTPAANRVVHSKRYLGVVFAAAGVSLVLDDVRVLALPQSFDTLVDVVYLFFVFLCGCDIALQTTGSEDYFGSLYFWVDLVAAGGVVSNIAAVYTDAGGELCDWGDFRGGRTAVNCARLSAMTIALIHHLNRTKGFTLKKQPLSQQRYSLSSISSQSPQMPRVVRSNSYVVEACEEGGGENRHGGERRKIDRQQTDVTTGRKVLRRRGTLHRLCKEGAVGEKLKGTGRLQEGEKMRESGVSKRITKKLVGMLAVAGVLVGAFEWSCAAAVDSGDTDRYSLRLVTSGFHTPRGEEFVEEYISRYRDFHSFTVLTRLEIDGKLLWDDIDTNLRDSEKCILTDGPAIAEFSIRTKLQLFALFDLCSVVLLCALFLYVTLDSSAQIRKMLFFPLDQMVETVQLIWHDPLHLLKTTPTLKLPTSKKCCESHTDQVAAQEVYVLENAFRKIGLMLGLVYGSAGKEMITNAISLQGQFSPLVPGRKILAIFCFATIDNFEESLDAMGLNILSYINLISQFVHSMSERYFGSVNKNLGDSYLLVWKAPPEEGFVAKHQLILNPYSEVVRAGTSLALLFAIKTISKVTCNRALSRYRSQLLHRQSANHLTFGFHAGWAFEGPIGSAYKIDASYLSPNVNMAARVATAAHQYSVSILLSHEVYVRLEDGVKPYVRHIDTVKLKGVFEPVQLYSFDTAGACDQHSQRVPTKRNTLRKQAQLRRALEGRLLTVSQMFAGSETVAYMRRKHPKEFFEQYRAAVQLYFEGQWRKAYQVFSKHCLNLVPFDGPTKTLMAFMEENRLRPPINWTGVRELTNK